MNINKIIDFINPIKIINPIDCEINGISYNSKTTKPNDLFVCLVGEHSDGHDWAKDAFLKGAKVFLCEKELPFDCMQIIVKSTKKQIADVAAVFYEFPSSNINLIGVTGTNGKTTVTHLLQRIFEKNEEQCALIGTLGNKKNSDDTYHDAQHTTPQAPELQKVLRTMLDDGIKNLVMEVSSHALEQNRIGQCNFNGAIFTNLTQDHLDYHITMENYFEAKAILFKNLAANSWAVINIDDDYANKFLEVISPTVKVKTYSVKNNKADFFATDIVFNLYGASFVCNYQDKQYKIQLQSNGMFSVYNALAALAGAVSAGVDINIAISALENTSGVSGRFETVLRKPMVIIDYAHTPDGLENVLKAARELTPKGNSLICLFGCGGDRDSTKRPKMGKIAGLLADKVIVTSDNPRSEDPNLIISDVMAGIETIDPEKVFVEPDRGLAIKFIAKIAKEKDVVLVAGKGHEDYQILKDETIHFNDKEEVLKAFEQSKV